MADVQPARPEDDRRRRAERSRSDSAPASVSPAMAGNVQALSAPPSLADLSVLDGWTQARITLDGRVLVIARNGNEVLASRVRTLARQARAAGSMAAATMVAVELLGGDEVLGQLKVGEVSVQLTVRRGGADVLFNGAVPAAQVWQLMEEVRRMR